MLGKVPFLTAMSIVQGFVDCRLGIREMSAAFLPAGGNGVQDRPHGVLTGRGETGEMCDGHTGPLLGMCGAAIFTPVQRHARR